MFPLWVWLILCHETQSKLVCLLLFIPITFFHVVLIEQGTFFKHSILIVRYNHRAQPTSRSQEPAAVSKTSSHLKKCSMTLKAENYKYTLPEHISGNTVIVLRRPWTASIPWGMNFTRPWLCSFEILIHVGRTASGKFCWFLRCMQITHSSTSQRCWVKMWWLGRTLSNTALSWWWSLSEESFA